MFHHYNENYKDNARALRSLMTDAEKLVWSRIRHKQICGVQFYRQKQIANYIVDFYAPTVNLVIEIDGGQHYEEEHMRRDKERDLFLNAMNLTVLRFNNHEVLKYIDEVMHVIYRLISESFHNK
jgi:very-short-patch-repair endonuclease